MNLLPVGALQTYEEKIACLTEDEFYDFFEKMDAEPRWVTSDGVRSIQIIGLCHHGGSHSALFDPTSRKVTCFSECGGGMLFHTWVKRAQELDSPQAAKEYISDWIDGQDIDFGDREPNGDTKFEYRERPFERCETPPLEGIELEVIQQMYREDFTHGVENLARTKWSTEDGIDGEVLELFQVAFVQKENYMVLPHHNRNGQIVGLYARSYRPLRAQIMKEYPEEGWNFWRHFPRAKYVPLNKEKKYLKGEEGEKVCWSFQNSKNLYGLHKAHEAIKESGEAIIFEGGKSVMLANQWGIKNTVASHTFGAGDYHINMLLNEGAKTIILGFDKQYESQDPYDTQWKQYEHRTYEFAKRIKNHCDVYRLCDRMDGKLDYKDAPVDKGEEYFKWLLAHKEPLFINGEDVYALKKEAEKAAKEEQIDIPLQKRGQSRHDKLLAAGIDPHAGEEKWYDLLTGFADLPPESEQYAVGDGKYQYGDLLIQLQEHSDRFLLPNEDNKSVTAYEIIKRLAGPEHFKALKKQIKPRNDKLQVLPYSERYRAIFFFRNQYRKAPAPENIDMIAAFIDMALWKTNNITLNQNWRACLDVTGSEKEAASLLVYYGWAPDLQKELPRLENAFYKVKIQGQARHYEIVDGDITERLAAVEQECHIELSVRKTIENRKLSYEEKYNRLQAMLKPRFWWKNGVGLGLTKDAFEECNQRIRDYINMLLDYVDVPLQEYIYNVEIDKSDPGFSWAAPRKFIVTMEDLEFSDYKYNINADTNRAKAAELGAARSMKAAQGNFESITGNEWTAQELYAQGIDKDKIPRLVKNGLIERTGRGRYRRISG